MMRSFPRYFAGMLMLAVVTTAACSRPGAVPAAPDSGSQAPAAAGQAPAPQGTTPAPAPVAEPAGDIIIGALGSYTGSQSVLGLANRYGVEVAVDEINAAGGVLGRKVRVIYKDDEGNVEKAVSLARELITRDKVVALFGPTFSSAVPPVNQLANENKIPMAMNTVAMTQIDPAGKFPYTFRSMYLELDQTGSAVDEMVRRGYKKLLIVHNGTNYAVEGVDHLKAALARHGLEPIGIIEYPVDVTDATPYALRIKSSGADGVINWGYLVDQAQLVKAMKKTNTLVPILISNGALLPLFFDLAGDTSGIPLYSTYPRKLTFPQGGSPPPDVQQLVDTLDARYGKDRINLMSTTANYYDVVRAWAKAVEKAGTTDGDPVRQAWETIRMDGAMTNGQDYSDHEGWVMGGFVAVDPSVSRQGLYLQAE